MHRERQEITDRKLEPEAQKPKNPNPGTQILKTLNLNPRG
jgi:hypothetical protein